MEGCLVFIIFIFIVFWFFHSPITASIAFGVVIILAIYNAETNKKTQEELKRINDEKRKEALKKYETIKVNIEIPENKTDVNYKQGFFDIQNDKYYIWLKEEKLCFFPCESVLDNPENISNVKYYEVPINDIEYYATQGEVFYENKISGGGGGGSSIGGAVVGGVIAGGAGAVIGSRKKTDSIKSELVTHDTRETFLNFYLEGSKHSIYFDFKDYNTLNQLLPEKAFEIVNAVKTSMLINNSLDSNNTKTITEKIREIAKLRDERIITNDEFEQKKSKLMDKII